jgi:opacity protein-like surface antigen
MRVPLHQLVGVLCVGVVSLLAATPAAAQFGVGARLAWVKANLRLDDDAVRSIGGQIRLGLSPRIGVEASLDSHSEDVELLNQKVKERPIQVSLLLKLATGPLQPYLLGGPGWYKRSVEPLQGTLFDEVSSTEFGWHAGGGLEVLAGKHFGLHGDYRYTFLNFGDDDDKVIALPGVSGLLPRHRGSMWTLGATVYF